MKILAARNQEECAPILAQRLADELSRGKGVLWLVPGGSNIPLSVSVLALLRSMVAPDQLARLAVTLTDERYGPVGHTDSNWKQLADAGFDFEGFTSAPALTGAFLEETVSRYGARTEELFDQADVVIGQFGLGADGHIAGALPRTVGASSAETAVGYEAANFTRITLTLDTIGTIDAAYAFAFGASKNPVIDGLRSADLPIEDQPAQILKQMPEAYLYTDQ